MSVFHQAVGVDISQSRAIFFTSLVAAGVLIMTTVAQLFTFEDFPVVLAGYPLPGGYATSTLLAALVVTFEVLAAPYLLMMRLSSLMRLFSLLCGVTSSIVWMLGGLYLLLHGVTMNSGLLGATVSISNGWLLLVFAGAILTGLLATLPIQSRAIVRTR